MDVHNKILSYRSIEHLINQPYFERLWQVSTGLSRILFRKMADKGDRLGCHNWIHNHPSLELGELSIRQLRKIAYEVGVKNYSRLSKYELIVGIQEKKYVKK